MLMRGVEGVRDLRRDFERLRQRQRTFQQPVRERLSGQMFHDEVRGTVMRPDVVEGADVGVIEGGDRTGLALESHAASGSALSSAGRILIATVRSRRVSRAL